MIKNNKFDKRFHFNCSLEQLEVRLKKLKERRNELENNDNGSSVQLKMYIEKEINNVQNIIDKLNTNNSEN